MTSASLVQVVARLFAGAALLVSSAASANSCKVQNSSAPGLWKFVRALDDKTGEVVLRRAINGGQSVEITVSGTLVRLEYKLAGDTGYRPAVVATCKGGNTLRI